MKKDLDEGKEICFDLLQNSQGNTINSRQEKNSAKRSQHAAKENEFTPEQKKHGCKTNLANSLRAGYASYFKAVFCVSCGSL